MQLGPSLCVVHGVCEVTYDPNDLTAFRGMDVRPEASVGGMGQKKKRATYHPVDYADAKRRYEAGETTVEIAAFYGVTATAIQLGLKRHGVRLTPHWERNPYPEPMQRVNEERQSRTHCPRGHEYTEENTRMGPHGRNCRECVRLLVNRRRAAQKAAGIKRLRGWSCEKKGETCCRNCGSLDRVQLHHAIPRSKSSGPSRSDLRNGIPLCHGCHWMWHANRGPIYRDVFTKEEWAFISSVELTGERIEAWLDAHYPARPMEAAA